MRIDAAIRIGAGRIRNPAEVRAGNGSLADECKARDSRGAEVRDDLLAKHAWRDGLTAIRQIERRGYAADERAAVTCDQAHALFHAARDALQRAHVFAGCCGKVDAVERVTNLRIAGQPPFADEHVVGDAVTATTTACAARTAASR